jgi:hypothetical protein
MPQSAAKPPPNRTTPRRALLFAQKGEIASRTVALFTGGFNPSAVIIDEAHALPRELFEALDTAVHKRPDAFWLLMTTAGRDGDFLPRQAAHAHPGTASRSSSRNPA